MYANTLAIEPDQITHLEYEDMRAALAELPNEMRQTLVLIGVERISYERAARACNCSVGTVKSRAHRARERLAAMLSMDKPGDSGGHPNGRSVAIRRAGRQRTEMSPDATAAI
jgi:RNA polymerase sigma-70 factor (ECF subfamily)